ncbi:LacI family DNA-binding transcriptional regulator [Parasphaerochaeta coccoides]|uniref:Transcriptional regulator, LacI family n=1 Tax=Parasphaerochaeta coccoides (strain ATCC BAA-1237 / DSM 17374 / SPN1) TaxID=760011 RepID=F4GK76_PARC1|nr:LacI family DNA-binding transcriptional regulator [Parasphaerochaeta coccoides]AEC02272.1 transcriptional regulator, LacI family [Parasphaerochaeta coccoides DSM 17374]
MPITIHDIAKAANVSPSTVSRVLNESMSISEKTKKKIRDVMEKLDYHPNSNARRLATGNSQAVGLVVDMDNQSAFSNYFFNNSVFGIEQTARDFAYNLLIAHVDADDANEQTIGSLIYERKVDGLVLPPAIVRNRLVKDLEKDEFPFVILGEPGTLENECSWVDVNNAQGAEIAVNHLRKTGYSHMCYIGGTIGQVFVRNRVQGYRNALLANGAKNEDMRFFECEDSAEASRKIVANLEKTMMPDAFICNDNVIAFGVLQALKDRGISVPDEAGVIAFDNYPLAEYIEPSLTVIDVDTRQLGAQAMMMLMQKIEGNKSILHLQISPGLIIRKSTRKGPENNE